MADMRFYSLDFYASELQKKGLTKKYVPNGRGNTLITTLTYDSRQVKTDTLFICKGAAFREKYLTQSILAGAVCYVSENEYKTESSSAYILVTDIRKSMAELANLFYNRPWEDLTVIGVGGTKGKSTTVCCMKAVTDDYLMSLGKKDSGLISSINVYDGETTTESHMTTPEAVELQRCLRKIRDCGLEYVQMEVSSQALKYHRVDGMRFDIGIFLNISEDHISPAEHNDFEDYFSSKMLMFRQVKTAIVNLDSDMLERVLEASSAAEKVLTFSVKNPTADFYAYDICGTEQGICFSVRCRQFDEGFTLSIPGIFNAENALSVVAAAVELNIPLKFIKSGLARAKSDGRMELYTSADRKRIAIVDYAHNKLSFEKLYSSVKEEYPDYDIVSIFGCPGKKALVRRRDLGTIAGEYAKKIYLTAEDPGAESVDEISRDIARYVELRRCPYEMIEDRGEAIAKAMKSAAGKTVFLITGKGRETRQRYGAQYIDCPSDVEYVKKCLKTYDETHGVPDE